MNIMINRFLTLTLVAATAISGAAFLSSCSGSTKNNTETEKDKTEVSERKGHRGAPGIDKSGDVTLQAMIKEIVPKFSQQTYSVPGKEKSIEYNLYTPQNLENGKKYPLVLFIADASTAGKDVKVPLTQGYGALVWAADEWQAKTPCYVLVPQLAPGATNDDYQHSDEVDDLVGLVNKIVADNQVDSSRLYSTGQSMGGMISMYYDVAYPDMFAASIFVDSHWDAATFPELVKHKFVWFIAGDGGKAYPKLKPLEEAAEAGGVQYTFSSWPASLPMARQDELAAVMLEKGAPVNIFEFETGSVLPEGVNAPDHMYSFDYAYRNSAVREWMFKQSK